MTPSEGNSLFAQAQYTWTAAQDTSVLKDYEESSRVITHLTSWSYDH